MKRYLFITGGVVSLALGAVGVFLPLLPTTPFLLLAAFCFLKSSSRLYKWLVSHKVFGKYIINYLKHRSVTLRSKLIALPVLWTSLVISMLVTQNVFLRIGLILVGIGVSIHILTLRTVQKDTTMENMFRREG